MITTVDEFRKFLSSFSGDALVFDQLDFKGHHLEVCEKNGDGSYTFGIPEFPIVAMTNRAPFDYIEQKSKEND